MPPRDKGTFNYFRYGPPQLPPHLLQCVLNAEISHNVSSASHYQAAREKHLSPFPTLPQLFVHMPNATHKFLNIRVRTTIRSKITVPAVVLLLRPHKCDIPHSVPAILITVQPSFSH